ncbi:MAG: glycosyltransferase family 2 protein [Planctomycetota bacterium]
MISLVIPVYNERESLAKLHAELSEVAATERLSVEFIFVDDGSTDGSWEAIRALAAADARVGAVRFRRNFGKAAALRAGFDAARGQFVATLDADLQDDPRELPRFRAAIDAGADLVSGWKQVRHDPVDKVLPSRIFNWLVSRLSGVWLHDHNCGYKMYRREVLEDLPLYGEMHRFIPVLAAARGWRVDELTVHHRRREFGRSKYGFSRNIKGFLDLGTALFLTRYGDRPQHFLGGLALASVGVGLALFAATQLFMIARGLFPWLGAAFGSWIPGAWLGTQWIAVGVILWALGLVAELAVALSTRSSSRPSFTSSPARVREQISVNSTRREDPS